MTDSLHRSIYQPPPRTCFLNPIKGWRNERPEQQWRQVSLLFCYLSSTLEMLIRMKHIYDIRDDLPLKLKGRIYLHFFERTPTIHSKVKWGRRGINRDWIDLTTISPPSPSWWCEGEGEWIKQVWYSIFFLFFLFFFISFSSVYACVCSCVGFMMPTT